ncbi:hypothetical protein LTR35_002691 [Friedmanniomyces endolithicus]|uniref:Altered inheritance of mitochondria protein 6 n=1 Tax=Friedmanniomyces endolithicus TaxID=329885 RepID=A0AAN6G4F5_9PEZI|nr:hypothetical protein LTS00_009956 [Friedmanniomyces endolithicus]KAK0289494.1 hypothetical protein LTR35_002691 [Friedmanniomyces endolithicus]KAK0328732.1 hypothetical protein LTR82_000664 [Friedmanniomyces endolithicus]KAK1019573.1 hypothetical protein LTR54_000215 [Friedmanniomyces endolithicus]
MFSALLTAALAATAYAQADIPLSQPLQKILSHAQQGPLYTYPTDLTQGIIPKPFHSHNDYWRPIPFYSALSVGALSVEADVWLYNGTLHIGHEQGALTNERTFDDLYIQPILSVHFPHVADFVVQFGNVRNETFNATQLALLESQVATAHAKGIMVRYWDQPGWPVTTRNAIWRILWNAGVDLLNVDDLQAAADYWQGDEF